MYSGEPGPDDSKLLSGEEENLALVGTFSFDGRARGRNGRRVVGVAGKEAVDGLFLYNRLLFSEVPSMAAPSQKLSIRGCGSKFSVADS